MKKLGGREKRDPISGRRVVVAVGRCQAEALFDFGVALRVGRRAGAVQGHTARAL